jgi:hypothetical protein
MNKSESIKELATALNKAQAAMQGAKKGATNPFFKSKYADLGSVINAMKEPFADNGLSYSQFPFMREGVVGVETILMHDSGEWITSELNLPMGKQTAQEAGSVITYARRYALQSIAGIPSEDDDGNAATQAAKVISTKQLADIRNALGVTGMSEEELCKMIKLNKLVDMQEARYDNCLNFLKKKATEMEGE